MGWWERTGQRNGGAAASLRVAVKVNNGRGSGDVEKAIASLQLVIRANDCRKQCNCYNFETRS